MSLKPARSLLQWVIRSYLSAHILPSLNIIMVMSSVLWYLDPTLPNSMVKADSQCGASVFSFSIQQPAALLSIQCPPVSCWRGDPCPTCAWTLTGIWVRVQTRREESWVITPAKGGGGKTRAGVLEWSPYDRVFPFNSELPQTIVYIWHGCWQTKSLIAWNV